MMFYAVQVGDSDNWDYGSQEYDEAIEMAQEEIDDEENNGLEVRIAIIDEDAGECEDEIVIRDGFRYGYREGQIYHQDYLDCK